MSKYLLDTCTLIDLAVKGRPRHTETTEIVRRLKGEGSTLYLLSSSIKDVYYILNRQLRNEGLARSAAMQLRTGFGVFELSIQVVDAAFGSDEPDFEDGLVRAAAELNRCDFIITSDIRAFRESTVGTLLVG